MVQGRPLLSGDDSESEEGSDDDSESEGGSANDSESEEGSEGGRVTPYSDPPPRSGRSIGPFIVTNPSYSPFSEQLLFTDCSQSICLSVKRLHDCPYDRSVVLPIFQSIRSELSQSIPDMPHGVHSITNESIYDLIRALNINQHSVILDAGCGMGYSGLLLRIYCKAVCIVTLFFLFHLLL